MSTSQPSGSHEAPTGPFPFLRGFLRNPRAVGSVVPSSPVLVQQVLARGEVAMARRIVELGPGTGVLTREILRTMPASGTLVAIERDPEFLAHLERSLAGDPRLALVHGYASELETAIAELGLGPGVDLVVSGIPFSTMDEAIARATLAAIHRALRPGGRFLAYQFRDRVQELARPIFGRGETRAVLWNLPPMKVSVWQRDGR